jgi:Eukaryotic aspartyl protease
MIDTGSFELWVDPDCSTVETSALAQACKGNGNYDPRKSTSVKNLQQTKTLAYDKGSVNLQYVSDSIALPGSSKELWIRLLRYFFRQCPKI